MSIQEVIEQAQEYMQGNDVDGWLLYDYRGLNPIFADTVGRVGHVTRPVWLWIPASGGPRSCFSALSIRAGSTTWISTRRCSSTGGI